MGKTITKYGAAALFCLITSNFGLFFGCTPQHPSQNPPISLTVSAAASLTDALKEVDTLFTEKNNNVTFITNFASSGTLQTQIENGAPVDVFISASTSQMDNLQKKGMLINDTRANLLGNKIVVVVPKNSTLGLTSFNDLALDKVKRIAVGDPKSVPAGTYAMQIFEELSISATVQPKEVLAGDVRQVLTYVEGGNVDAGIVYLTDALTATRVDIVASAPTEINAKIVYPAAVIQGSKNQQAAREYLSFLSSAAAKTVFGKYGFNVIVK